ncbi:beta-glucosidase [Alternaria panax]|uniref:beta-glucosidase n=1 Tax=Alternaria panax TaxID=48097 RepID=A0AAD4FK09_9PLEO|nr:beta-glucosidase [Alternaria panax]
MRYSSAVAVSFALLPNLAVSQGYTNESEVPLYGLSPPVYPSPVGHGTTSSSWASAYAHAKELVSQLTLEEKSNLTHGVSGPCAGQTGAVTRLQIPELCFADSPSGVRGQEFVSSFPAGIHLGATFDRGLMLRYGHALGREYRGKGINVALGPFIGPIGRVVRGGRNWEGLGADPYLGGIGGALIIRGTQKEGVIATPKHWLVQEQEYRRRPGNEGEAVSSNVDDRTLHELYAWPFMNALREGAGSLMCSYQRVNNSYGCQNSKLLNGMLKEELGFEGFVVSDWDAQQAGVASANAGLDVVMPIAKFWGGNLTDAVNNGSVTTERLDDMNTRLLAAWFYLNQDKGYPEKAVYPYNVEHQIVDVREDHASLIREIGAAGTVLVKNVNNTLPLRNPRFLNIYGYDAEVKAQPWNNPARFGGGYEENFGWNTLNGTLVTAGGSGSGTPPYVISPFKAIQDRIIADSGTLRWDFFGVNPTVYANAEACLVFINAYASESFDRISLTDEFSDQLVNNVATNCSNTIVVIHNAGIRTVNAWIDHPNITAVLFAGIPGQESGNSIADVLYGDVNPSGRLPYTVARQETDYGHLLNGTVDHSIPAFMQSNFTEGLYIDYRAFDAKNITPQYEFGYGLSYTTFGYANITVERVGNASLSAFPSPSVSIVQGGHPWLWQVLYRATVTIINTGKVAGHEVAQLYLGVPNAPQKQLRGFERVGLLQPGESREVEFALDRRDLSVWNVTAQAWELQKALSSSINAKDLQEDVRRSYGYFIQTIEKKSAFDNQIEDTVLLSAFQKLGTTAEGYIEYTNEYGSVEDWVDTHFDDDIFFRCMSNACAGYADYEHQKTSTDCEFFRIMRAGLKSMEHTYDPPPAKGEFFEMAIAGMKTMKYAYDPPPMHLLSYPPLPDALQTVYRHMGYTPVEDLVFLDIVASFENTNFSCAWGGVDELIEGWGGICLYSSYQDQYWLTPNVLDYRDIPKAVTYMYQTTNSLGRIEDVVFRDLLEIVEQYMEYTNDFDNWNDPKIATFREFSIVSDYVTYVCPDYQWFRQLLDLPAEIREGIMHEYLLLERDAGRLSKHQHYDEFNNPCCKWEYPRVLIVCDNQNTKAFPKASTGRCPKGWLPSLAFVSHRMHEEVLVMMLQRTERFDMKYMFRNIDFKIATWFSKFLKAIPGDSSENAVRHLNFPHMHWFNHERDSPALTNPSLDLAVVCKNLRKLDMTFHVEKVNICNHSTKFERKSRPLPEVIDRFKLETIFGCTSLEEIYIDGIYDRPSRGGDVADLDVLEDLGKWMMKGFLVERNLKRGIQVELVRRWGAWRGRVGGALVTLNNTDMAQVRMRIGFKKAYARAEAMAGPALII